ncbi:MAG TPA: glycosyltransferase family 4 protein, partial [Thermodesulfovibrionales bacterium]|nr:glycosyltransferase family 4 protein [Thermodesulfovibrionales bacterium]
DISNRMRILHTEWSDGLGGQEKRVLAELTGLAGRGYDMLLVCRQEARIRPEAEKRGIRVITLPLRRSYDVSSILKLRRILREQAVDIVNTHSGVDSWIGAIAAKLAGVPLLVRTRHLNIPLKRNPFNFVHYLPDLYITCGENMRNILVNQCRFAAEKVVSIPTGIPMEFFDVVRDAAAKKAFGLDPDSLVISNVGILRRVKGHETTFRAVPAVVREFPRARFLIVGDGPRRQELERMAEDMNIRQYLIFTGFVEDIGALYACTDIAILSSWSEGLPQSVLQALACSVPVIATRVGGVPEVVIPGKTGILVEAGDHEGLAREIIAVLREPAAARQMALAGKEFVKGRHSIQHMLDRLEGVYTRGRRKR